MNTNTFVILTTFSMIFIILSYYGIIRYLKLHIDSHSKYIENYKNLPKASENNKVIISFSSNINKINKIMPMLKSILDQTVKVDQIVLNLPPNDNYNIPKEYNDILNIFYCGKDYCEATKLIPTLLREDNADTIIILLKDDYIYGKDFIETMIEELNKDNSAIISNNGILIKTSFFDPKVVLQEKNNKNLTEDWILNNIKNKKKYIKYRENFKSFKI